MMKKKRLPTYKTYCYFRDRIKLRTEKAVNKLINFLNPIIKTNIDGSTETNWYNKKIDQEVTSFIIQTY